MAKRFYSVDFADIKSFKSASQRGREVKEDFMSSTYLYLKFFFSLLAIISLMKLGYTSKVRFARLREIRHSFLYEKARYQTINDKFDNLFSHQGEIRFMKDQDQMISRDVIRVIWR